MSRPVFSAHDWPRVAALALIGTALAGCSSSGRFDTPYASNTQQPTPRGEVTGSVAPRAAAPTSRVYSQPLPQPSRPQTVQSGGGTSGGSQGLGAYRPAGSVGSSDVTGSVAARPAQTGHWTWDGGQPVTVGYGDSVEQIARKYGVPSTALLQTNGITDPSQVRPGQRLVIPRYVAGGASTPAPQVAAPGAQPAYSQPAYAQAAPAAAAPGNVHVVAPGESLIGLSRRYRTPLSELARLNGMTTQTRVSVGDRIKVPGNPSVAAAAAPRTAPSLAQPTQRLAAATPAPSLAPAQLTVPPATAPLTTQAATQPRVIPIERANAAPTQSVRVASAQETPKEEPTAVAKAEPAGSMPSFRWPVQGRVIAGFGPRPNGTQNDGINIAVPEGTQIKAADDGVVAYSGNELKGYGNLVLVRHANGYVSAYANASELLVKRGDTIRRGQVIAHAGQTGNVTSPQLHFEIRKGSTPVDPTKYLAGM